ncbi:MAG: hypothetical protein ABL900_18375 [Burkholderiaceae bacterium]
MKLPDCRWAFLFAMLVLLPGVAAAHSFAPPYTLPVPFSLYAGGAAAALVLSFVIVGVFAGVPALGRVAAVSAGSAAVAPGAGWGLRAARALSLGLLILCIASGLLGTQNPYANFNMTFFWIVFVLGVPYVIAVVGDFYAAVNPWKVLVRGIESLRGRAFEGRVRYPQALGCYPALLLYMAFIWIELFARLQPRGLALALLAYTAVNVAGAWLIGTRDWFRHGEFFAVFLRLMGKMSIWARPWDPELRAEGPGAPRWRAPFRGLLDERADHVSLVLFVLFMLSSTAFDGLHATLPWVSVFWKGIYPGIAPLFSPAAGQQYALSTQLYYVWQWLSMLISPLAYLLVFVAFVAVARWVARSALGVHDLVLRFGLSLVPIAFVYHVTHYYTLLLAQVGQIVRLVSDPLGLGWNLFGTGAWAIEPFVVDVEAIWHTQVALILLGHIVSVYLAHVEALQTFATPRRAAASQLPMLVLMVLFTTLGLWILSLPLSPAS